jgi:ankyrin repeat protein
MPHAILLLLATIALAAGGTAGSLAGQSRPPHPDPLQLEEQAQRAAWERLQAIFAAGPGDPEGDARRAAEAGNFRLIWVSGFGISGVHGGHCRFPIVHPLTARSPLTLTAIGLSDTIPGCEGGGANACLIQQRFGAYAIGYNRAIRADPRFPYADLCAQEVQTSRLRGRPGLGDPASLAPGRRIETETPRNFGEAVRRGSRAAVARMLAAMPAGALDRPDDFGITPLGWAVIDRRPDIARMLLARGADPIASFAPAGHRHEMPVVIALATGQRALADAMLTPATRRRLGRWPAALIYAAVRNDHVTLVRQMLADPETGGNAITLLSTALDHASPAMRRAIVRGDPNGPASLLIIAILRRDPALVREALALRPRLGSSLHSRSSALGNAVQHGGEAMDDIVRQLLAAGAAADSPADWSRNGYPTGSTPPTALVALVALADRTGPGPPGPLSAEIELRKAAQRRTLDLLLAAGASVHATDSYDRPLAVLAVTDQYDPRGMRTLAELPPDWLDRLARAGMDVNATWLGSTALDWADALGMSDSATARALVRLGGRRVKPADPSGGSRF